MLIKILNTNKPKIKTRPYFSIFRLSLLPDDFFSTFPERGGFPRNVHCLYHITNNLYLMKINRKNYLCSTSNLITWYRLHMLVSDNPLNHAITIWRDSYHLIKVICTNLSSYFHGGTTRLWPPFLCKCLIISSVWEEPNITKIILWGCLGQNLSHNNDIPSGHAFLSPHWIKKNHI